MHQWVIRLDKAESHSLAAIRCTPDWEIAMDDASIWIRSKQELESIDGTMRQLPIRNTFFIDTQNRLFSPESITPTGVLKELTWQSLSDFIKVSLPVSGLPGKSQQKIPIQLRSAQKTSEGVALMTSLEIWKKYAETAPEVRLESLQFAVSENNQVLITGLPLPSLPGTEFWNCNNILLPSGYEFEVPMMAGFINKKLNPQQQSILLFDKNGGCQLIDKNFFIPAKRSSIRLTTTIDSSDINE